VILSCKFRFHRNSHQIRQVFSAALRLNVRERSRGAYWASYTTVTPGMLLLWTLLGHPISRSSIEARMERAAGMDFEGRGSFVFFGTTMAGRRVRVVEPIGTAKTFSDHRPSCARCRGAARGKRRSGGSLRSRCELRSPTGLGSHASGMLKLGVPFACSDSVNTARPMPLLLGVVHYGDIRKAHSLGAARSPYFAIFNNPAAKHERPRGSI